MGYPDHDRECSFLRQSYPCHATKLSRTPCVGQSNQPNQSHTNTQESFVHKVCLWWGEPFEKNSDVESSKGVENPCVSGSIPPRATIAKRYLK